MYKSLHKYSTNMLILGALLVPLIVIFYIFLTLSCHIVGGIDGGGDWHAKNYMQTNHKNQNNQKSITYLNKPEYKKYLDKASSQTYKYFDEIPHALPYEKLPDSAALTIHIGQLKLFLTEVEFLTEVSNKDEDVIMIYAGSAPCMHASFLSEMFPKLKMILVDPNEHIIYYPNFKSSYDTQFMKDTVYLKAGSKNMYRTQHRNIQMYDFQSKSIHKLEKDKDTNQITEINTNFENAQSANSQSIIDYITNTNYKYYIIEDYFTNELAKLFSMFGNSDESQLETNPKTNVLFCSDIRTDMLHKSEKGGRSHPGDIDILWNLALQYNWLNIMQPAHCMLKFRCPFYEPEDLAQADIMNEEPYKADFEMAKIYGIDFITDYKNKKLTYIKPDQIYIQAFAGAYSTEARLVSSNYSNTADFDWDDYQSKFFYYNLIDRQYGFHEHPLDRDLHFDACGDCALTYKIMLEYYEKFNPSQANPKAILASIKRLMQLLRRKFNEHNSLHGQHFKKYKTNEIIKWHTSMIERY